LNHCDVMCWDEVGIRIEDEEGEGSIIYHP
jgi:hypothetical protein